MSNNNVARYLALVVTSFCLVNLCRGQGVGPAVETPTTRDALTDALWTVDNNITVASEFKSAKNVVEQEKPVFWNWYSEFGYESKYIFRGTNMTPDSDGDLFLDLEVSKWGFTLGVTDIYQLGTARAKSFSIGEGGGSGTFGSDIQVGPFFPETVQTFFNEIDGFLQYAHDFGPVNVTVGNIAFFIDRDAQTFVDIPHALFAPGLYGPFPTVQNEQFDRVFIRLATSVIPHIQPWITYYQTLLSQGEDHQFYEAPRIPPIDHVLLHYGTPRNDNYHERNEELGGYLEIRLRGNFPVGEWFDINPFWIISYSCHDRSEPVIPLDDLNEGRPGSAKDFKDTLRGRSLVGWNHTQVGIEAPIHLLHFKGSASADWAPADVRVNLVPFGDYSYHISTPTAGTDRNEWWGGAKVAVTF
jgi:hypothetical protein